jgi:hypothetical protein
MVAGRWQLRHFIAVVLQLRAGRFSIWLLFVSFSFCIFIRQQFRADDFQMPPHRQAVTVSSHASEDSTNLQNILINGYKFVPLKHGK